MIQETAQITQHTENLLHLGLTWLGQICKKSWPADTKKIVFFTILVMNAQILHISGAFFSCLEDQLKSDLLGSIRKLFQNPGSTMVKLMIGL